MKLCTIYVDCLTNMPINTHYFILPNNDFTGLVYELRGQPLYINHLVLAYSLFLSRMFLELETKLLFDTCIHHVFRCHMSVV